VAVLADLFSSCGQLLLAAGIIAELVRRCILRVIALTKREVLSIEIYCLSTAFGVSLENPRLRSAEVLPVRLARSRIHRGRSKNYYFAIQMHFGFFGQFF
jgi:hypothetical protein